MAIPIIILNSLFIFFLLRPYPQEKVKIGLFYIHNRYKKYKQGRVIYYTAPLFYLQLPAPVVHDSQKSSQRYGGII